MRRATVDEERFVRMLAAEGGPSNAAASLMERLAELEAQVADLENAVRSQNETGTEETDSVAP